MDLSNDLRIEKEKQGKVSLENEDFEELLEQWRMRSYTLKDFPGLLKALNSSQMEQQHYGVIGIRRLVSKGNWHSGV